MLRLYRPDKIRNQYRLLGQALGVNFDDEKYYSETRGVIEEFKKKYGKLRFAVGEIQKGDPIEMALMLIEEGFEVKEMPSINWVWGAFLKDMDFEKIYRESAHLTELLVDDDWESEKARARPRINKGYKDVVDIIESWGLEAFETHNTVEIRIPRGLDSENVVTEWEHLNDLDTMGEDRILNYADFRAKMSPAAVNLAHKIYDTFDCENIDQVRVGRHKCYAIFLVNPRVR
jgi:hypothetical protein